MKHYFLDDLQALKMVINSSKFSNLAENFEKAALISVNCLKNGNTILICGNGGSASDAEHMAGEIEADSVMTVHHFPVYHFALHQQLLQQFPMIMAMKKSLQDRFQALGKKATY